MHLRVAAVGQRAPGWVTEAWLQYSRRLPATLGIELREVPLARRGRNPDIGRVRQREGEALLAAVPGGGRIVALDIEGKAWSTGQLSEQLKRWMAGGQDICFLIGGPDGLTSQCLQKAEQRWSLGPLTLPHALVRVIVIEQLYRAWSILSNHPYHRA